MQQICQLISLLVYNLGFLSYIRIVEFFIANMSRTPAWITRLRPIKGDDVWTIACVLFFVFGPIGCVAYFSTAEPGPMYLEGYGVDCIPIKNKHVVRVCRNVR
jgi:hypothetical protein